MMLTNALKTGLIAWVLISQANAQTTSPGLVPSDVGGVPGYQHSIERSRFGGGAKFLSGSHKIIENGFEKTIGDHGIFAVSTLNGLAVASESNGANKGDSLSRPDEAAAGGIVDPDRHNQMTLEYFVSAGIPQDQISGLSTTTYLSANGSVNDVVSAKPKVDGYATILERKADGFVVVDSSAWARMDSNGNVINEWVYWPAIPARAIEDAKRLSEIAKQSDYLQKLPPNLPPGRVVIRHSSATADGPLDVIAAYDVVDSRVATVSDANRKVSAFAPVSYHVRHFDVDGVERVLAQERRSVGGDYPPKAH